EPALAAMGSLYGLFDSVGQQGPIGQSGQCVVQCHVLQCLVGLVQRLVQLSRFRDVATVEQGNDQGDAQHGQSDQGNNNGQPVRVDACIGRTADTAYREAGGFHAAVMHAHNGTSHRDGGDHLEGGAMGGV